ncbi:MAG: hypothetical protein JO314_11820 [Acidobacteria bacterium]|nr:hypothetical protein [Acidobacteriota bacterium]
MKGRYLALCLDNDGYKASLEVGKVYPVVRDKVAEKEGYLRVVDESGDDYAFAAERFHIVELPLKVKRTLAAHAAAFAGLV